MVSLGLFMQPMHDPAKDWLVALREDQQAVVLADELGFSECWIGEHFTSTPERITSPLMFLATLIDKTKSIRLGTGVINLPYQHPAVVAARCALFDHLSEGRFMFGIGAGGLASDFELFGYGDPATRGRMMMESIDAILRIWSGDPPYHIPGDYWSIGLEKAVFPEIGVGTMPKPYQKPHPPIAMSVLSPHSGTGRICGERGWIPISANFLQATYLKSHWQAYCEGCEKAARRPDPSLWRVARSILVTESDAEAEDYLADPGRGLGFYYNYLLTLLRARKAVGNFKGERDMPDEDVTVPYVLDTVVIRGSPKTVLDRLIALRDQIGPFGTLIMTGHDWDDEALWRGSMRRLAEEVMPALSAYASQIAAE